MAQGAVPGAPSATALVPLTDEAISALGAQLIEIGGPFDAYANIDPEDRPRATFPDLALLNLMGPQLTCEVVKESERIERRQETTHVNIVLHFHRGKPTHAEWAPLRAVDLRPTRIR